MPQKVLSVVSTLGHCGPMKGKLNVIRRLDPLNYRSVIVTLSPEPADSLIQDFRSAGVLIVQMGLSRTESLFFGARKLRGLAAEIMPDIVHSHGLRADLLVANAELQCPIVSTVHSDLVEDYRFAYGRCVGALAAKMEYTALRRFDGVNAVSEPLREVLMRAGVAARAIPNGVEPSEFYPASNSSEVKALRASLGWPSDAVVILHTGVLRNLKNPIEVVTGFRASRLSHKALLVFAGDGLQWEACQRAAGDACNILFLGNRRDVSDLLRAADILISASRSEGFGTALLEGCACGVRVLATDIPPHRSIQKLFPDQMQIFEQGSSDCVRAALDGIPSECQRQKFQPSPSTVEMISTRRMANQYQDFYANILQSRRFAITSLGRTVPCR